MLVVESPMPARPAALSKSRRDRVEFFFPTFLLLLARELFPTDLFYALVGPLFEITVLRMIRSTFARVTRRVVAADQGPTRMRTAIGVRTMQKIRVKKQRAARFEFAVDKLQMLQCFIDTSHVGACLIAGLVVIDAAHQVRALEHLKTTVFPAGAIDGDQATRHVGKQAIVRVPVTVILMPLPRAAYERLLQHHLVMVMINLTAEHLFQRFNDTEAADEGAVNVVLELVR